MPSSRRGNLPGDLDLLGSDDFAMLSSYLCALDCYRHSPRSSDHPNANSSTRSSIPSRSAWLTSCLLSPPCRRCQKMNLETSSSPLSARLMRCTSSGEKHAKTAG